MAKRPNSLETDGRANPPVSAKVAATDSLPKGSEARLNQWERSTSRSRRWEEAHWEEWVRVAHQGSGRDKSFVTHFQFSRMSFSGRATLIVGKSISKLGAKGIFDGVSVPRLKLDYGRLVSGCFVLQSANSGGISAKNGLLCTSLHPPHLFEQTNKKRKRNRQMRGLHCKKATKFYLKTLLTAGCSC